MERDMERDQIESTENQKQSMNMQINGSSTMTSSSLSTPVFGDDETRQLGSGMINPSGNLARAYIDMSFKAPGFTVNVSRAYNSLDTRGSLLSQGWSFGFSSTLTTVGGDTVIHMPDGSTRTFEVGGGNTYTAQNSRARLVQSGSEHILTTPDYYEYLYNAYGYLIRMTDPCGNQINLTVNNANGQISSVVDSAGRTLTLSYTNNRISSVMEYETGITVQYAYDANGRLNQVTAPDGGNAYYTYNSDGLLYQVKDHNAVVLEEFTYATLSGSTHKRLATALKPTGNTESYAYNLLENKVTATTGSRTVTTCFDDAYYFISRIDAEGGEEYAEYNLDGSINRYGELTSYTDRNNNTTSYEYDDRGKVTRIIYPNQGVREYEYDYEDNLIKETDERGSETHYTYDSNHNLLTRTNPLGGVEIYTYYTLFESEAMCGRAVGGLLKSSADAANSTTTFTYNAQGNLATSTDCLGRVTTYSFNTLGWLKQETTPMGFTTAYYYDKCGRLVKKVWDGGESERCVYGLMGRLSQRISPMECAELPDNQYTLENIMDIPTVLPGTVGYRYTHTSAGLPETLKDPLGNTTNYQYDVYGNKTQETLPNGAVYTYAYDKLNRVTNKYYQDGGSSVNLESYSYPLQINGTVKEIKRAYTSALDWSDTVCTYDFARRLIEKENPDGGLITSTYLPNGLMESESDAMGAITYYEYTPMNQREKRWSPHDGSLYSLTEWQYDAAGRVVEEKRYINTLVKGELPSGQVVVKSYLYNEDSTIQEITINGDGQTQYQYNDDKQISRETKKQDSERSQCIDYTYNYWGKVETETNFWESMDVDGQPDTTSLCGSVTEYNYNRNGQVECIRHANNETTEYEYDAMDRRTVVRRNVLDENNVLSEVTKVMTYDSLGNVTSSEDEKGNITTYTYDQRGFLVFVTEANNAVTAREYDLQGRLIREISPRALLEGEPGVNYTEYQYDAMNRLLKKILHYRTEYTGGSGSIRAVTVEENTWDKNGKLLTAKDGLGNITTNSYSAAGHVAEVENAVSETTTYSYDGLGRMTQKTNARGVVTEYSYDLFGNLTEQKTGSVTELAATYDTLGHCLTKMDGNGNTSSYVYGVTGKVRSVTGALGYSVRYWYDGVGNQKRSLDSNGKEVINSYDGWGRLLSAVQRESNGGQAIIRSSRYDVLGNPAAVTDERGNTTEYSYDELNRVIGEQNARGQTRSFEYDANGNKMRETNWLGNSTEYQYDMLNRLVGITDSNGIPVETLTYTDNHLQDTSTDALGNMTVFAYDGLKRLISTTDAMGNTVSQTYDRAGNIASKTDGNGNTTLFAYDGLNRMEKVTHPDGTFAEYGYDGAGNVVTETDGRGNTTRTVYNALNLPVRRIDPAGSGEEYEYAPDGKLESRRDKNGAETRYRYDIHGRKVSESVDGEETRCAYDNAGNLLRSENSGGAILRSYDELNRVVSKTAPGFGTIEFTYDETNGLPVGYVGESVLTGEHTVTRVYDKCGRLRQVRDGADVTEYSYYLNGGAEGQTLPGELTVHYTYYANNKLESMVNKRGGIILESYGYTYDSAGNMTGKQDGNGTTQYSYTALNQLAAVTEPGGKVTVYVYDAAGNRTEETVTEGGVSTQTVYDVDRRNRLTGTSAEKAEVTESERYYYDGNGNVLFRLPERVTSADPEVSGRMSLAVTGESEMDELWGQYSYNGRNQLVQAGNGVYSVHSGYDAEGRRSSKRVNGEERRYCYEYDRVIKEVASTGDAVYNVYGNGLISRESGGGKVYYLYNGQGDVTALVDGAGEVVACYSYDAFGNITGQTGGYDNPYRYRGYSYDEETGLYDLKARFYDAKIARFLQEDMHWNTNNSIYGDNPRFVGGKPVPDNLAIMQSLNRYTYTVNNPIRYSDPTGYALTDWDRQNLSESDQQLILHYTEIWNAGNMIGNNQIKSEAAAAAVAVRDSYLSGSQYVDSWGNVVGDSDSGSSYSPQPSTPTGTPTTVILSDGTAATGYLNNGTTYMTDGSRPPEGAYVWTNGGYYVMQGGAGVPAKATNVILPSGTVDKGAVIVGGTTYISGGSRPPEGTIVQTAAGYYKVVNGKGVLVPDPTPIQANNYTTYSGLIRPMSGTVGGYETDSGLDIFAPKGTPVYAVADGTIEYSYYAAQSRWSPEKGMPNDTPYRVNIKLEQSFEYGGMTVRHVYYDHLSAVTYDKADGSKTVIQVKQGDLIGYSGTGNNSPHLHLSFYDSRSNTQKNLSMEQTRQLYNSQEGTKWIAMK